MAQPQNSHSPLLNLSVEVLQHITSQLDDDRYAMYNVRLTCKTLETATFDQFTHKFFRNYRYCVFERVSWLRLKDFLASSSRLLSQIRSVHLDCSCLADHTCIQLAPGCDDDLTSAQVNALETLEYDKDDDAYDGIVPSDGLMDSVFAGLQRLGVRLSFDVRMEYGLVDWGMYLRLDVLDSIKRAGIALEVLAVSGEFLLATSRIESGSQRLLACASSLQTLVLSGPRGHINYVIPRDKDYLFLKHMLGSASSLRRVIVDLSCFKVKFLISETLVGQLHSMLDWLHLNNLLITSTTLLRVLSNCGSSLTKVVLREVHLDNGGQDDWSDVLRALSTLPRLCELELYNLVQQNSQSGIKNVNFSRVISQGQTMQERAGNDSPSSTSMKLKFRGRDEVSAGLQEILRDGLAYV